MLKKLCFLLICISYFSCTPPADDGKNRKSEEYWDSLQEFAEFNDREIAGIQDIYRRYDIKASKLPEIDGKKDEVEVKKVNRDRVTELVRLLGGFPEFRKIKAFDKEWNELNKNKRKEKHQQKKEEYKKNRKKAKQENSEMSEEG